MYDTVGDIFLLRIRRAVETSSLSYEPLDVTDV